MDNDIKATDAAPTTPVTALVRHSPFEQVRELVAYLKDLDDVCNVLCKSTLLPRDMQTPANLKLVLVQGLEMGFSVVQAIRASFIITSKEQPPRVGYYVEALVALVRTRGSCRFFRVEECTATKCRVVCARNDEDESMIHVFEMTMEQAQKANLDKKWEYVDGKPQAKQKYTWITAPADMLRNRTCGRAVKSVFQDVVFGMATPDELDDVGQAEVIERVQDFSPIPVSTSSPATTRKSEIVDAEIVYDNLADVAGTGDAAWDELMRELGKLNGGIDMSGWFPPMLIEAWDQQLLKSPTKRELNALAPWIGEASKRASRSKACSAVSTHMSKSFNERSAELRTATAKTEGGAA